ncbi:uncharacterized protein LOC135948794 [Calliphora vicina]|uniref:uncharacterized protein LOC135948794 n=1 Tax=Calliphora vicina TaxID=7373 RepID=UPI00325B4D94
MTASSVEFFPCRAPLMGLPRSSTSLAAANTSNSLVNSIHPPAAKIKGISRNLFGAPDPLEMKNLYQQEAERQRSYVLQRYNFDTINSKPTNEKERQQQPTDKNYTNQTTNNPAKPLTQIPTLIELELRQHEQRLQIEEHGLNRTSLDMNPPNETIPNETKSGSKVTRRCCEYSLSLLPAAERQKPYTRQSLLKESFNIRKNKVCVTKNGKDCNGKIICLENSQNSHRNLEILQLPKPEKSLQKECNINENGFELRTCNEVNKQEHDEIEANKSTTISCNDNCTTYSLQLVVSTQNVS